MFVAKDFARCRFLAQICVNSGAHAHFGAYLREEAILNNEHWTKSLAMNIGTISKNMPTNFQLKRTRLKLKLDIVENLKIECTNWQIITANGAQSSVYVTCIGKATYMYTTLNLICLLTLCSIRVDDIDGLRSINKLNVRTSSAGSDARCARHARARSAHPRTKLRGGADLARAARVWPSRLLGSTEQFVFSFCERPSWKH